MSTKEIRRVLDALSDAKGEGYVRRAMAEIEAIERAATTVMRHGAIRYDVGVSVEAVREAETCLSAIAKDAK